MALLTVDKAGPWCVAVLSVKIMGHFQCNEASVLV